MWECLRNESQQVEGRGDVFLWRGRTLLQPRMEVDGRLVVVEEGTGAVILRTEGAKASASREAMSLEEREREEHKEALKLSLPLEHLERLLCPPGVTHGVDASGTPASFSPPNTSGAARRTRHLYGKQALDGSLWFGGT